MNINYLRFVNSQYVILGMDKLKNQKNYLDSDLAYVAEVNTNPISCFKLLKAYSELLLCAGASPEDILFPAMTGQKCLKKCVSYVL